MIHPGLVVLLWVGTSLAQEPEVPPTTGEAPVEQVAPDGGPEASFAPDEPVLAADAEADADDEAGFIEVLVVGEQQVLAARDDVVRAAQAQGWKVRRRRNGKIFLRGREAWMGKAELTPQGTLEFNTPAFALDGPQDGGMAYDADAVLDGRQGTTGTVGVSVATPGPKKVRAAQQALRVALDDELLAYRQVLQQRHFGRYVTELPNRFDALWERGEALDGGDTVTDPVARRAAVLDLWASRTDTPEGRTVSRTIEIWLRNTVMSSDHPVTVEEAAAAEARRTDGRSLDVF